MNDEDLLPPASTHPKPPFRRIMVLQILNILGYVILILFTLLTSLGHLFPYSPKTLSDKLPTKLTPSPFTFSIWGIIYILATFFVIYQALPRQRLNRLLFHETHVFFFLSCLLNVLWLILFCQAFVWASAAVIVLLEICLIVIYLRINRFKKHSARRATPAPLSQRKPADSTSSPSPLPLSSLPPQPSQNLSSSSTSIPDPSTPPLPPAYSNAFDYIIIFIFFSLYLGWVTVATVVNIAVALRYPSGWDGHPWNETGWAIVMLVVLVVVAMVMGASRRDAAFGMAVAWACFGIYSEQKGNKSLEITSLVFGVFVLAMALAVLGFKYWKFSKTRVLEM